jgi:hypothetical protein
MVYVEYTIDGEAINDFQAKGWIAHITNVVQSAKGKNDVTYKVSTSLPLNLVRLEIAKGTIDCNDIYFLFNGEQVVINQYGCISNWPKGFADIDCDVAEQTITASLKKRKALSK